MVASLVWVKGFGGCLVADNQYLAKALSPQSPVPYADMSGGLFALGSGRQDRYNNNFNNNRQYAKPSNTYATLLDPTQETAFRQWVAANKAPFNPNEATQDYDMRGYWRDVASTGRAETAINPNDHQLHFPDTYKTPYHQSFSAESQYAQPNAPRWINDHQLADPVTGRILFDERAPR